MLAFSNDYYGMIFRATQSVELFCAYDKRRLLYNNNSAYKSICYGVYGNYGNIGNYGNYGNIGTCFYAGYSDVKI